MGFVSHRRAHAACAVTPEAHEGGLKRESYGHGRCYSRTNARSSWCQVGGLSESVRDKAVTEPGLI